MVSALLFISPALFAAQNSPAPPTAGTSRPGSRRTVTVRNNLPGNFHFDSDSTYSSARILPPGTWWKDQELAKRLDLSADQQKRIAELFLQSKIELIHMHASLEEEELLLEPMLNGNPPDQAKTLAQISKIADTRADLEKANAKMLLGIRGVLNQAQWAKLQQERPGNFRFDLLGPVGPHSFELTLPSPPDTRALMEQMRKSMPDMQKLQRQLMRNGPELLRLQKDVEDLQQQIVPLAQSAEPSTAIPGAEESSPEPPPFAALEPPASSEPPPVDQ